MASKLNRNKIIAAAQRFVQRGQLDKAIREYHKLVEDDPRDVRIWLKIGDLQARKGANSDAVDTYTKVAEYYSEQGFYLKAVAVYKQILRLDPDLVEVNLRLAELYKQLGLLNDAMRQYEQVSSHLHQQGRDREALDALRQIINLDPANVASRIKLAELYSKQGMMDQAVDEFSKAADYLRASNRLDDFIKVAERLIYHQPDNLQTLRELSKVYLRRKDPARALQKLQMAFKLDPRDIGTLEMLAEAFQALKQRNKTISVLKELARLYEEVGERAKQASVYERILQIAPEDEDSRRALRRFQRMSSHASGPAAPPAPPGQATSQGSSGSRPPPPPPPLPQSAGREVSGHSPAQNSGQQSQGWPSGIVAAEVPPPLENELVPNEEYVPEVEHDSHGKMDSSFRPPTPDAAPYEPSRGPLPDSSGAQANPQPQNVYGVARGQSGVHRTDGSGSAAGTAAVAKIIAEAEVYIKYGLQDKAVEHLEQVFEQDPYNAGVRLKLRDLYVQMGQFPRAARELVVLAQHLVNTDRRLAADLLNEAMELDPENAQAHALLAAVEGSNVRDKVQVPTRDSSPPVTNQQQEEEAGLEDDTNKVYDLDADIPEAYPVYDQLEDGGREMDGGQEREIAVEEPGFAPPPGELEFTPEYEEIGDEEEIVVDTGLEFPAVEVTPIPRDVEEVREDSDDEITLQPVAGAEPGDVTAGLEDDLEEAEFFIQQSLYSEARAIMMDLLRRFPSHPLIEAKLAEMEMAEEENRSHTTIPALPHGEGSELDVSLEAETGGTLEAGEAPNRRPRIVQTGSLPVQDAIKEFRRDEESIAGEEDTDTHYDLGIAYREMGLMEDAVKEFEVAMRAPEKQALCYMMIGLCYMDRQDPATAIEKFKAGLALNSINEMESLNLTYELGEAFELAFQPEEALAAYIKVANESPRFREVASKVHDLRAQLGADPDDAPTSN